MPTQDTVKYLDGKFEVTEERPSTISEIVAIIGEVAVVDEAVDNLYYRNKYPRVYSAVSKEIAKLGFAKKVIKTKETKEGVKNVHESDMDHIRAAVAGETEDGTLVREPLPDGEAIVGVLFAKIGPAEPLYVKGERTGGSGKISQDALDSANKFFASGDDKVEEITGKLETLIPGYSVGRDADGLVTPESLARGIMRLNKKLADDAKKAAVSALGA